MHAILRQRLLQRAGVGGTTRRGTMNLAEWKMMEWSDRFEQLMRNRLVMGRLRYGSFRDAEKGGHNWVESIITRAKRYQKTGNDELLVDIANCAMVEFERGDHPDKHFRPEDDGEHVGVMR